jgi:hypothetical protein
VIRTKQTTRPFEQIAKGFGVLHVAEGEQRSGDFIAVVLDLEEYKAGTLIQGSKLSNAISELGPGP